MSSGESSFDAKSTSRSELTAAASSSVWSARWQRIEDKLERLGDRLNPILVKEARQAMKSRQFIVTFSLLLAFGWMFSLAFIAFNLPGLYYSQRGGGMLVGYYLLLSVPLMIVVPYSAFRSLAAELEDGTFELLSITTLTARQIVTGKLGSAVLQMIVYYSALAPCIAFTYLLRGIDVVSIGVLLAYTFLAALMLSIVGLMLATVTRARHWQVVLSVLLVIGLLLLLLIWDITMVNVIMSESPFPVDEPAFWQANLAMLMFYLSFAALFLLIAAGQLTFVSENRSTRLRYVLLTQTVLLVGWMMCLWQGTDREIEILFMLMAFAGSYWAFAGALLASEQAALSERAKRRLPQSFLGRMLLTWFNPGSGAGYVFAIANLLVVVVMIGGAQLADWFDGAYPDVTVTYWCLAVIGYVAGYIGGVRLLVVSLRRSISISPLAAFLGQLCVALLGVAVPLMIQSLLSWGNFAAFEYTPLQWPNWIWTLMEVADESLTWKEPVIIFVGGSIVFGINLIVAAREVQYVRQLAPARVRADDDAQRPAEAARALSPWDKPEQA